MPAQAGIKKPLVTRDINGFSLIETFITLLIGLLVMQVMIEMYLGVYHVMAQLKSLREIRHTAFLITNILESDIRQSGYIGCRKPLKNIIGTDSEITLSYMAYPASLLLQAVHGTNELVMDNGISVQKGDSIMIADCMHAEIMTVRHVNRYPHFQIISAELHHRYEKNAEIAPFVRHHYFVHHQELDRVNESGRKMKMAGGVTEMKLRYDWQKNHASLRGIGIDLMLVNGALKQPWHIYVSI